MRRPKPKILNIAGLNLTGRGMFESFIVIKNFSLFFISFFYFLGGGRGDLSPPRVVEELSTLLEALGVSDGRPATVIGFGIGGMLAW